MNFSELLAPELTFCNVNGPSKKRLLELSAQLIAGKVAQVSTDQIYEALIAREQLGSTGIGGGIAIPHCRIPRLTKTVGCLLKLQQPVDFDAIDKQPVDLLFFLLVPENTLAGHLEALKTIAERFSSAEYCKHLRAASTDAGLYDAALALPGS
ncbi:MAG: PTS IIA-like nitrogen regulatory protein PtsN [Pseudohongiellaceae bacterium]